MESKQKIDWEKHNEFINNYMRYLKLKNKHFRKRFGKGEAFMTNARKYLKDTGRL